MLGDHQHNLCVENHDDNIDVSITCIPLTKNDTPIDTSQKEYLTDTIVGFCVRYEPDVFVCHPSLRDTLEVDLRQVLPSVTRKRKITENQYNEAYYAPWF